MGLLFLHRAFVGASLDLIEQHVATPAALGRGAEVIEAAGGIVDLAQHKDMMPPGD